jgi:hypothetical protein
LSQRRDAEKDTHGNLPTARREGDAPVDKGPIESIRETVIVRSDPGRAFELFTSQMGTWWPVESYSRAVSEFENETSRSCGSSSRPAWAMDLGAYVGRQNSSLGGGHRVASAPPCVTGLAAALRT